MSIRSQSNRWPPSINQDQLDEIRELAINYALSNSLIIRPINPKPGTVTHIPLSLFPSPFPRDQFEKALRIQTYYNKLYAKISSSPDFLRNLIGRSTKDEFIGHLYEIWDRLERQKLGSKIVLGIFRSDYLLHQQGESSLIKQVEFNTVSVSFGCLGTKISDLHRYLTTITDSYSSSQLPQPPNHGLESISDGLALAHETYLQTFQPHQPVIILMITQPNERNVFDQALLVHSLAERHGGKIRMIRLSCHDIIPSTELDPSSSTLYYLHHGHRTEVSVVYYRSMYGPEDFISETDWEGRERLERSRSINSPNLATQLSGCKKVQQVLTTDSIQALKLDQLLTDHELDQLRSTWMPIYPLDHHALSLGSDPLTASHYVLKPQREGGGHNVYRSEIPDFLSRLPIENRDDYILMRLIETPPGIRNILIRPDQPDPSPVEIVSELGVLGVCIYKTDEDGNLEIIENNQAGHLLRTKNSESDEGGVAVGISCLDSPYLV